MSQPYTDRGELDGCEVVVVSLIVSGRDSSEVFEFVEEAFDQVAIFVEEVTEHRFDHALRHGADIGPGAARIHFCAQSIGVIGPVGKQDISFTDGIEHVGRAAAIGGLAFGQLEHDRQPHRIDQRMYLRG